MLRVNHTNLGSLVLCHNSTFAIIDTFSEGATGAGARMVSAIQTTCINKSDDYCCY